MPKKRPAKKKDPRQTAYFRFMIIVGILVIWTGFIGVRLVQLQVTQHTELRKKALGVRQDVVRTKAPRGTIYDRNGRALAMSVPVKTLYADPKNVRDVNALVKAVSKAIKIDSAKLTAQIAAGKAANKRFIRIAKHLDPETVDNINRSLYVADLKKADSPKYEGLHWMEDQKRSYPYQTMAAHVVGFANSDDDGLAGIERSQDENLHGAVIKKVQERDRHGRVYDEEYTEREQASDVVLSIDTTVQFISEQALEKAVKASNARSGIVIVMKPKTGEILALANYPTFDPNLINEAVADNITNRAIESVYSPGSVFKLVTYGSALEKKTFAPEDMIDSGNGSITVGGRTFRDSNGSGPVSYSTAMARSSNVCAIKTAVSVGKNDFHGSIRKFGFGTKTGIELPAETSGIVRSPEKWNGDSIASLAIGYEIGVTALQMTSAFATIANDGIRVQPHIVKEVRPSNDKQTAFTQVSQTQVVSVETARRLKTMLKEVVISGTGKRAQLEGFSAAGKTGTAWKFDPKTKTIDSSKYVSSFIGMAPADDPEIVIGVVMDEPKAGGRDGGSAAAPVFSEVAQGVLKALNLPPDQPGKPKSDAVAQTREPETAPVPPIVEPKPEVKTKRVATNGDKPVKPPAAKSTEKLKPVVETKPKPATKPAAAKPPAEKRDTGTQLPSRKRFET